MEVFGSAIGIDVGEKVRGFYGVVSSTRLSEVVCGEDWEAVNPGVKPTIIPTHDHG